MHILITKISDTYYCSVIRNTHHNKKIKELRMLTRKLLTINQLTTCFLVSLKEVQTRRINKTCERNPRLNNDRRKL